MAHKSKRIIELEKKLSHCEGSLLPLDEAVELMLTMGSAKFSESFDVVYSLGLNPKKSDENIKANIQLPHGLGKSIKVAVFAIGDQVVKAEKAGADRVGLDDLAADMKKGETDYDVVIATQETMPTVGKLGQILGPKGLMPNLKLGTVTSNVAEAVKLAKAGQFTAKNDKNGLVHGSIGKSNFSKEHIIENIRALTAELKRLKPSVSKGVYMKYLKISLTMSPSISVDVHSI